MRTIRILVRLLLICVSTSFAQATSSPTVAFVYLGDRGTHRITAFSLQANGSAHPVPGSPFSSAALSNGFPSTSLAASTNFVFATDSEHIATFRRSANGALTFASVVDATVSEGADIVETLTLDRSASNLYARKQGRASSIRQGGTRTTDRCFREVCRPIQRRASV